jgi:Fe-S-cluster containining protein
MFPDTFTGGGRLRTGSAVSRPLAPVRERLRDRADRFLLLVRDRLRLRAGGVAPRLMRKIFRGASLSRCDATCCKGGVAVSIDERRAILRHRGPVAAAMEASPREGVNPRAFDWFTVREKRDPDFLCGRSVDTRVVHGACVFLRADRLCAVHAASEKVTGHPYALKPAYCILFPLAVEEGALDVCRGSYTRRPDCCSPVRQGTQTAIGLCAGTATLLKTVDRVGVQGL